MNKIEKMLRKMPKADRERIAGMIEKLLQRQMKGMTIEKLKGTHCLYRVRSGDFRILYFDDGTTILLKAIRRRNEGTYQNL